MIWIFFYEKNLKLQFKFNYYINILIIIIIKYFIRNHKKVDTTKR